MTSLYQQIGGEPAVDAATKLFYTKVLKDDRIKHFFDDLDMDEQIEKQKQFLTMAFGGPITYSGKNMKAAHSHLMTRGLDDEHVDAVIELLGSTLQELSVPHELIKEAAGIAESVRESVLGRG